MSAKGRKAQPENPLEFHTTPAWATLAALPIIGRPRYVLDAGCGAGAIGQELRKAWPHATIFGVELDPDRANAARRLVVPAGLGPVYDQVVAGDFLTGAHTLPRDFDLVIANPPFTEAIPFAQRSLELVRPGGIVAFLLRLNILAGHDRRAFWRGALTGGLRPDVNVLERRPGFNPAKPSKTDATEYAWLTWGLGLGGRWDVLECAPSPMREKRQAAKARA